jgi:UDP-N-acetylglucosamine 2-epimerase (non-hydrolysing)
MLTEPLGYIDFLSLTSHAAVVLTDSGGLQEESTALGIPCLTLRENTERPITITHGTNRLVGIRTDAILAGYREALRNGTAPRRPPLWDGRTADRIVPIFERFLQ